MTPALLENVTKTETFVFLRMENTLTAFANSIGFKVRGDLKEGGYWTRFLSKNIVKDQDICLVLADTWTDTVQFTSERGQGVQGPSITACMGRFNLRRKFFPDI